MTEPPVVVHAAGRPHPAEQVSGDAWTVERGDSGCRLALVDGLGHGPAAAAAAGLAVATLRAQPGLPPLEALRVCHAALRAGRGAAALVADVDLQHGTLTIAGVGNVDGRLWTATREQRFTTDRGVLGLALPTVRPLVVDLPAAWLLVLHTDGVSARFDLGALLRDGATPAALAVDLLARHARPTDDATVIVAVPANA